MGKGQSKLTKAQRKALEQEQRNERQQQRNEKQDRNIKRKSESVAEVKIETPVKVAPIAEPIKKSEPKKVKKASRKWSISPIKTLTSFGARIRATIAILWHLPITILDRLVGKLSTVPIAIAISFLAIMDGLKCAFSRLVKIPLSVARKIGSWLIFISGNSELQRHTVGAMLMIGTLVFCYWIATL